MAKRILLGLHDLGLVNSYKLNCELRDYEVDYAPTIEQMIEQAKKAEHQAYLMDVNLGSPGSEDITPAVEVFNLVRSRIVEGLAKFIGISGDFKVVEAARKQGIPAENKMLFNLIDFLEQEI